VTDSTSIKIEYLRSLGSMEVSHSGESLFDHLFGVQKNLRDMGAPEYLQDAGLFHSVYGTMKPSQLRHDLLTLNLANQDQMDDRRLKKFDV
jgi:hypothetical protein